MASHSTQALGVVVFLVAATLLAGGLAAGGSYVLIGAGLALLAFSIRLFVKAKAEDKSEE